MEVNTKKALKTELQNFLENKEVSGENLKSAIKTDLDTFYFVKDEKDLEIKDKIVEYVFSVVSLLKNNK